ncbi:hypothetical protein AMS68_007274 [Peltaster fructicola]|uniref:Uncharacterized protein n=1 Tax=Peltaster fructicola TaxID=286661 RepID=A0A6H0Y407_9PEZI|nr:hypothetical protein AMS68_007274 [Peltaster fructicola]
MAPKPAPNKDRQTQKRSSNHDTEGKAQAHSNESSNAGKKRKAPKDDAEPVKSQRRSGRANAKPSQKQLLGFLLSREAEDLTRPDDERKDIEERGEIKTYSSAVLNPFEELLCAIVLSRPISHRLGLRTIRTVLNEPYNFTSAKAVQDAGSEKQHQALWDARTQHKDKTAQQLGELADVILEKFTSKDDAGGKELGKALEKGDVDAIKQALKSSIKGLGVTGLDIFFRRVQWLWDKIFPYTDGRTADSLRKFELPYEPEQLVEAIDTHWKDLETKTVAGEDEAQKKRRAFVIILERVTGADLEGKVETILSHASQA